MAPIQRSYPRILLTIALPTAVVLGAFYIAGKYVETRDRPQLSVTGIGEAKLSAEPDLAQITLGVQTGRQPTAPEAMDTLRQSMSAILAALREQGIEEKDVQTSNLSLYPASDWIDGEQVPRGYEASQNVTVTVRDIAKTGDTISAATAAGSNYVSGAQFTVEDVSALRSQGRTEAIARAREEAKNLAAELGMRLGDLAGFSEDISPYNMTSYAKGIGGYGGAEGMGGGDMDMPAGQQEYTVRVYLTYRLR
ncbi:MAG: SIMPL domain-containing protein [Candidatus Peribacteraceae bacterium]|nr:SIMPL domain-containing protein [Candidatus Peribacteria bacterium]